MKFRSLLLAVSVAAMACSTGPINEGSSVAASGTTTGEIPPDPTGTRDAGTPAANTTGSGAKDPGGRGGAGTLPFTGAGGATSASTGTGGAGGTGGVNGTSTGSVGGSSVTTGAGGTGGSGGGNGTKLCPACKVYPCPVLPMGQTIWVPHDGPGGPPCVCGNCG